VIIDVVLSYKEDGVYREATDRAKEAGIDFDAYSKIYSDDRDKPYIYTHKNNINVDLKGGYYNFNIRTNSTGLREANNYEKLDKSVIFLGDSVVEGASVENNMTMDTVYENLSNIPTLNFGVGSRGLELEYQFLKYFYKKDLSTKLIVLGFCLNDFDDVLTTRYFDQTMGNWRPLKYFDPMYDLEKGFLYQTTKIPMLGNILIKPVFEKLRTRPIYRYYSGAIVKTFDPYSEVKESGGGRLISNQSWTYWNIPGIRIDAIKFQFSKIKKFANSINSDLLVVLFPAQSQITNKDYNYQHSLQQPVIKMLSELGITQYDLYYPLKEYHNTTPNNSLYWDDVHFHTEGHKIIGNLIYQKTKEYYPFVE